MSTGPSSSALASLQAELAQSRAREASVTRIAVQSVALLRAQDANVRPAGMWLKQQDHALLAAIQSHETALGPGGDWKWAEITEDGSKPLSIIEMFTESAGTLPRPTITPFRSAFPLEILEYIVTLAGSETTAIFAQASFGCLQLFGPQLLASVTFDRIRASGIASLFADRDATSSARSTAALSLHHMHTLDVTASALHHPSFDQASASRLSTGSTSLHLSSLIIRMDFSPNTPETCGNPECENCNAEPSERIVTFRPSHTLLSLLNPNTLRIRRLSSSDLPDQYRLTREGAIAIAAWTRLRTIELDGVDPYVLGNTKPDHLDYLEEEVSSKDLFFLGPSISIALGPEEGRGRERWAIQWDLSAASSLAPLGEGDRWESLPEQLAFRDGTLEMERVKTAVILVKDEEVRAVMQRQLQAVEEAYRGPLRVEVKRAEEAD